ncbi:MAG TPA: hypothetical protein VMM58_11360 [Bacteroidota bacterium]|nr:hypothetical protein [Bacteroidota bacterium]
MKTFSTALAAIIVGVIIFAAYVNAQEIPSQFDLATNLAPLHEESPGPDSLHPVQRSRLLPPNMSIMENGLWGEDGFLRKTGIVGPLTPQERKNELSLRRTMLTAHQVGGFVTLGLMWSAAYFGQQIIDGHPEFRRNHQYAVTATIISYSATGMLAILSPPPLIRRDEMSTTTIHKTLAWVHVAGMILTPILGGMVMHRRSTNVQMEHFHQISGYATTAVFTASMIVVTF